MWRKKKKSAPPIVQGIRLDHTVVHLKLTNSGLGDDGIKQLAGALPRNKTLRWLHLDNNQIGNDGARHLGRVLKKNSVLIALDLDHNLIGNFGAFALASGVARNNSLQELDLHFNQIGSAGAMKFAEALLMNSALRSFSLHGNAIGDEGATFLARALQKNSTLQDLHLGRNAISDKGAFKFARALKINRKLWALHLTENEIGDAGATSLAKVLPSNPAFGELWLLNNKISEAGARKLAQCVQNPGSLRRLGITFYEDSSSLEFAGHSPQHAVRKQAPEATIQNAARLPEAAPHPLGNQKLGDVRDERVKELIQLIQSNTKMKELHLKKHFLSIAGMQHLVNGLQQCTHLEKIYLGGRPLGDGRFLKPMFFVRKTGTRARQQGLMLWKQDSLPSKAASSDQKCSTLGHGPKSDEDGAPSLAFSEVPSTLGLDTEILSNVTDNFSVGSAIQDEEQNRGLCGTDALPGENIDGSCLGTSAAADKLEGQLGELDQNDKDGTANLSFDQVPDTLAAISDTESVGSSSSKPTVASGAIMDFDQVPEELLVSDDENEDKEHDDNLADKIESSKPSREPHEVSFGKVDIGENIGQLCPSELDHRACEASGTSNKLGCDKDVLQTTGQHFPSKLDHKAAGPPGTGNEFSLDGVGLASTGRLHPSELDHRASGPSEIGYQFSLDDLSPDEVVEIRPSCNPVASGPSEIGNQFSLDDLSPDEVVEIRPSCNPVNTGRLRPSEVDQWTSGPSEIGNQFSLDDLDPDELVEIRPSCASVVKLSTHDALSPGIKAYPGQTRDMKEHEDDQIPEEEEVVLQTAEPAKVAVSRASRALSRGQAPEMNEQVDGQLPEEKEVLFQRVEPSKLQIHPGQALGIPSPGQARETKQQVHGQQPEEEKVVFQHVET